MSDTAKKIAENLVHFEKLKTLTHFVRTDVITLAQAYLALLEENEKLKKLSLVESSLLVLNDQDKEIAELKKKVMLLQGAGQLLQSEIVGLKEAVRGAVREVEIEFGAISKHCCHACRAHLYGYLWLSRFSTEGDKNE